jgi:hypothetical protein
MNKAILLITQFVLLPIGLCLSFTDQAIGAAKPCGDAFGDILDYKDHNLRFLDDPNNVGKAVAVRFDKSTSQEEVVPQRINKLTDWDDKTKTLIEALKQNSGNGSTFKETAAWLIYTDKTAYTSGLVTGDHTNISERKIIEELRNIIFEISSIEGSFTIQDIEFFHTHLEPGEALSPNDMHFHNSTLQLLNKYVRNGMFLLKKGSESFATHAVPVNGRTFFSYQQ